MKIEILLQTGMFLVAVITIVYTQYKDRRQNKILMFSEYTRRYQEILINMPESIFNGTEHINAKTQMYMRLYFDLCSEEYHLWRKGMIPNQIWEMWKEGMQITTNRPIYKKAWKDLSVEYNKDFWQYFVEELSGKVERFKDVPPVEKKRQLLYDYWDTFPNQKSIMMNAWFAIKHTYDFTKTVGTISYYLSNDYALWLYDNHRDVFETNQEGLGVMIRLERQKMIDYVFMPTFNKIVEVSQKAISELSSKGMSFDYIFFAGGMSLMSKLSSLMVEKLGGVRNVFCADTHEASRFVCGGSILYGAAYMYINGILLRRRSRLYYYTSCLVETPNRSIEDLVLYFVYEYNLSASKVREILKAEQNLFKPQLIIGEYYCTVLSPICRADEIYKNYNGSFIPVDKSNPLFVSRIWSSTGLTFLPGDIKGNSAQSNKIHFEGMIECTYDSNKEIEIKIDFNKVAENSYFIVEYFYPSGEKVKELKIDRVETIIGH